jgi:hypothetical protein
MGIFRLFGQECGGRSVYFEMLEIFSPDKLFIFHVDGLFDQSFEFLVSHDDFLEFGQDHFADIVVPLPFGLVELLDHRDDLFEDGWPIFLDIAHEVSQLLVVGASDDEFVALLEKSVELASELGVREERVAHFEVALMLILAFFILP